MCSSRVYPAVHTGRQNRTVTYWDFFLVFGLLHFGEQELSYRKQIACQLRTQYVEGTDSNPVILKSRLRVTQGHRNWCHSKAWCGFLSAFRSNYGAILYRLRDMATYWSKIAKLLYPPVFSAPAGGDFARISQRCLIHIKLEWVSYRVVMKLWQYVKPFPWNTGRNMTDRQNCYINITRQCVDAP